MDIVGRSLRDRIVEALVVFATLAAFDLVAGEVDPFVLAGVPVAFLVVTVGIDAAWYRLSGAE